MKIKDIFIFIISILIVGFLSMVYKNLNVQREFFEKGEKYLSEGNYISAVDAYERVILMYIPVFGYTEKALKKINEICDKLDGYDKLYCYETIRASLFQIQSFYQPFKEEKESVTRKIVELRTELYSKEMDIKDKEKLREVMEEITTKEFNPDKFWSFLAPVSLIGWIGCAVAGIWYRKLYFYGLSTLLFLLWVFSLYMA